MRHELWAIRDGCDWVFDDREIAKHFAGVSRAAADQNSERLVSGGVAVIDVFGPIVQSGGIGERYFGMASSRAIAARVRDAAGMRDVGAILLRIDTPGGIVNGCGEASDAIYEARRSGMPVVAHVMAQACSLGYWLASQASEVYAERTTIVGCLGTIMVLYDTSKYFENQGIVPRVITRARFKAAGVDGVPLDDEMLEYLRRRIDEGDAMFRADVQRGRAGISWDAVGNGQYWSANDAQILGLVDVVQGHDASMARAMSLASMTFSRRNAALRARML